jgi:hypothetical protein
LNEIIMLLIGLFYHIPDLLRPVFQAAPRLRASAGAIGAAACDLGLYIRRRPCEVVVQSKDVA